MVVTECRKLTVRRRRGWRLAAGAGAGAYVAFKKVAACEDTVLFDEFVDLRGHPGDRRRGIRGGEAEAEAAEAAVTAVGVWRPQRRSGVPTSLCSHRRS